MGRDRNKKRNKRFLMIYHDMLDSEPFLSLSSSAKVAWMYIAKDQNGKNDGHLKLPYNQAKRLMDPKTFHRVLIELQTEGFITITKQGGLRCAGPGMGDCTEYALSFDWRDRRPPEETTIEIKGKGGNPPRARVEINPGEGL